MLEWKYLRANTAERNVISQNLIFIVNVVVGCREYPCSVSHVGLVRSSVQLAIVSISFLYSILLNRYCLLLILFVNNHVLVGVRPEFINIIPIISNLNVSAKLECPTSAK